MTNSEDGLFQPQKVFYSWLSGSLCIRPYQLYGMYGKIVEKRKEFTDASIYFIVEIEKIRFIPKSIEISRDGTIKFAFLIGNKRTLDTRISLPRLICEDDLPEDFHSLVFGVKDLEDYRKLLRKSNIPFTGICMNDASNEEKLVLNVYGLDIVTTMEVPPQNVLLRANINIGASPNILYIGQSKNIRKRTSGHEKIQRALSEVNNDKEIYLYFFDFETKIFLMGLPVGEFDALDTSNPSKIDFQGKLNLVEMALINYFKPRYNEMLTKTNIPLNKQVERLMKKNKYTQIDIEVNFDSDFWQFGSDMIPNNNSHLITFNLENPFLNMDY